MGLNLKKCNLFVVVRNKIELERFLKKLLLISSCLQSNIFSVFTNKYFRNYCVEFVF